LISPHTVQGRWWFGNRQKTKDGINAKTAAAFFKALTDNSGMKEVIGVLGKAYRWEATWAGTTAGLEELEKQIDEKMGSQWREVKDLVASDGKCEGTEQRALVLLYAHFLRLQISNEALKQGRFDFQKGVTFLIVCTSRTSQIVVAGPDVAQRTARNFGCAELVVTHFDGDASARLRHASSSPWKNGCTTSSITWLRW
jgi:hypothetical protein